jgi:acyl-coenzyme A thioesterase PaaI-like protein
VRLIRREKEKLVRVKVVVHFDVIIECILKLYKQARHAVKVRDREKCTYVSLVADGHFVFLLQIDEHISYIQHLKGEGRVRADAYEKRKGRRREVRK